MTTEQIHDSLDILQKLDAVEHTLNECAFTCDSDAVGYIPSIRAAFSTMLADIEMAMDALRFVRHRDARWHDDDVVTPALSALDKYKPLTKG